ncbi:MAG: hypothetical protein A4E50_00064 [Methanosaeta sp. PtaB.Bin087]|nr:MAG: hypothetical protein A4E50_00064 [Methanosaeta sp. PtaB.Bin087]
MREALRSSGPCRAEGRPFLSPNPPGLRPEPLVLSTGESGGGLSVASLLP